MNKFTIFFSLLFLTLVSQTFLIASGTVRWTQAVDSKWETAGNWTTVSGTPNTPPGPLDTVEIGTAAVFPSPSTISISSTSGAVTIRAMSYGDVTGSTLTIVNGSAGSLTITGDLAMAQSKNSVQHTITINDRSLTVQGSVTGIGATSGGLNGTSTIDIATGTFAIGGSITINTRGVVAFSGAGTLTVGGAFTNGGTFTVGTCTVDFNGAGAQSVPTGITFYNLSTSGSGTKSIAVTTTVNGVLSVNTGSTLGISNHNLNVAGAFTVNGTLSGTGPIALNTGAANIDGTGSITNTGTLTISAAKTILSTANLSISGTITINGTQTVTNNGTVTTSAAGGITGSGAGSTWLQGSNATLNISGPLLLTGTLTATANGNTVNYAGAAQTVKAVSYYNLSLGGSGIKTMPGSTTAVGGDFTTAGTVTATALAAINTAGNFTVGSGTSLVPGAFTHDIKGNFSNSGIFTATGSTVTLSGSASQTIGGSSETAFNNLTITNTGAPVSANTNFSVVGTLTVSASAVFSPAAAVIVSGAGTLTGSGTVQVTRTAATADFSSQYTITNKTLTSLTVEYVGAAAQTLSALTYGNLKINNSNGVALPSGDATVNGLLTFTNGNITTGSNKIIIPSSGSVSRTSGHVAGNLQKNVATGSNVARAFEIGGTTSYRPIDITFASVTTAGNLLATVSQAAGEHPSISSSGLDSTRDVNCFWTMTNSGIIFTNYSATFHFVAGDTDVGANTNNFVVRRFNSPSSWLSTTAGTRTSTSTQATGITGFSDYAIGDSCSVPTTANAGPDQEVCSTTATLAGNAAAIGTGAWTVIAGSATVTTPSSPTSGVTGLSVGANTFVWTISNPCGTSRDTVTVTRDQS
ncbi:MAG: hypothetical protein E6K56_11660, partial [Ignavibacteria bacterium]